jgi:hypothetical protein
LVPRTKVAPMVPFVLVTRVVTPDPAPSVSAEPVLAVKLPAVSVKALYIPSGICKSTTPDVAVLLIVKP